MSMFRYDPTPQGIAEAVERARIESKRSNVYVYLDDKRTACYVRLFLLSALKARGGYFHWPVNEEPVWYPNNKQPKSLEDVETVAVDS